jgi:dihydroxyacetone kinase-like protein
MKKLINRPETFLEESLLGFAAAHADMLALDPEFRFIRRRILKPGKVALVSGGGAGHEPLHIGFVGRGMLDAACPGQIFTSPTPGQILAAMQAVDTGAGTLLIVKNYEGDVMNFDMAAEMGGERIGRVLVDDDVAIKPSQQGFGRRGVAGTVIVEKLLGAAAEQGRDLDALQALAAHILPRIRSMGVALNPCTMPAVGRPTFELGPDEIELGVGLHGEAGVRRAPLSSADGIAEELLDCILRDLPAPRHAPVLLLVNGFGSTPMMELYAMAHAARTGLERHGFAVARHAVGSFATSLDMAGCSITVAWLDDDITRLWDAAVETVAFRWG